MEPGAQRIAHPERTGLLNQDQESGLKGVFHVVRVEEHAPANPHDQGTMPLDQRRKRLLGSVPRMGCKPLQELSVGQLTGRSHRQQRAELPQDPLIVSRHHRPIPRTGHLNHTCNVTPGADSSEFLGKGREKSAS